MGVLTCNRNSCRNVMSDYYSDVFGYLCWECFEELVGLGPGADIQEFMDSKKHAAFIQDSRAHFGHIFKKRVP